MMNYFNERDDLAFLILPMLGKHPDDYPRFRDCFTADEDYPKYDGYIHVYLRTGGHNREDYKKEHDEMMRHPNYIANFDEEIDCTYASWIFSVPKKWEADFLKITTGKVTEISEDYKKELHRVFPELKKELNKLFNKHEGDLNG